MASARSRQLLDRSGKLSEIIFSVLSMRLTILLAFLRPDGH